MPVTLRSVGLLTPAGFDDETTEALGHEVYELHFDFVWRTLRRLGVPSASADDAAHDVFLIVLQRGGDFAGDSSLRTWIFGVAYNVARNYRRKALSQHAVALDEDVIALPAAGPEELLASRQRVRLLYDLLDSLSDGHRAVFVLAEMEEMVAPEIAAALAINLNTVYSRLRAARSHFNEALKRRLLSSKTERHQ